MARIILLVLVLNLVCSDLGADDRGIAELLKGLEVKETRFFAIRDLEDLELDAAPAVPQLISLLDAPEGQIRSAAADALGAIGKDATAAIPKLVEQLHEGAIPRISTELPVSDVGVHAAWALGKMGEDAVPYLVPCLKSRHSAVRSNAICALISLGPDSRDALTPLIGCLNDRDWLVRQCAAEALGQIGLAPERSIPALVETLRDKNRNVRRFAASALGEIRPTTRLAVRGLTRALRDKDGGVQHEAAEALGKLGADAAAAVPALVEMLASEEIYVEGHPGVFRPVAKTAARALGAIGPPAKSVMPAILDVIRKTDATYREFGHPTNNHEVRTEAAIAAARIDPQNDELVDVLGRSLQIDDRVRRGAAIALALIGPKAEDMVPTLVDSSERESPSRSSLLCACAAVAIRPDHQQAVAMMLDGLQSVGGPHREDGWELLRTALMRAGADSRPAIPILIEMVRDRTKDRRNAARMLASFGPTAQEAIPALVGLLEHRWPHPRQEAIAALQRIASERSTRLLVAFENANANVRTGVVEVLGRFPGAVPKLTEALNDSSARVRLAALQSLTRLRGRAETAAPQIWELLLDDSRTVREAAARAFWEVKLRGP